MFAWRVTAILAELERWLPENCAVLRHIAEQLEHRSGGETWPPTAHVAWDGLRKISIDFGVMEKAEQVLTVPMACQWLDLGSWSAIAATRTADANGNVTVAPRTLLLDARDNILVSEDEHLLAALGVRDLIIVHSPDATLICQRAHEQEIRALVELCRQRWPAGSNRLD